MRWSEFVDEPRLGLELELAKAGTTARWIAWDVCDVPELQQQYGEKLRSLSREARLRLALDWFGDQGHPQPPRAQRTPEHSLGVSPDFGRLHRLADEKATGTLAQRDPLPVPAVTDAVRLRIVDRVSWPQIEQQVNLSHRKLDYVRQALEHGDLGWDLDQGCITLGALTRNTAAGLVLPSR